jgi:hypothetical protein
MLVAASMLGYEDLRLQLLDHLAPPKLYRYVLQKGTPGPEFVIFREAFSPTLEVS